MMVEFENQLLHSDTKLQGAVGGSAIVLPFLLVADFLSDRRLLQLPLGQSIFKRLQNELHVRRDLVSVQSILSLSSAGSRSVIYSRISG